MILNFKNADLFYTTKGIGNPVVFLHGFLENHEIWNPFISKLPGKRQVITIDLPGHGKSGCTGYIHTMEEMAEAVHAVFLKLKISEATFFGHSMGGYVSLAFLEKYPEKVANIVLLNSTPEADSEERKENRERAIALIKKNPTAFVSMALSNLLTPENNEKYKSEVEEIKANALKMTTQGIIAAIEGMKIRKDRKSLLLFFQNEKTIIAGIDDPVLPFDNMKETAKECSCSFVALSGGHLSFIEDRAKLHNFIDDMV